MRHGKNQLFFFDCTGHSVSFLVFNSILEVENSVSFTANLYFIWEKFSDIANQVKDQKISPLFRKLWQFGFVLVVLSTQPSKYLLDCVSWEKSAVFFSRLYGAFGFVSGV